MKNKFTKKYKNVLIIKGTQGMAQLSLAVVLRHLLQNKRRQADSTPRARKLSLPGGVFAPGTTLSTPTTFEAQASSAPRARKLSLLRSQVLVGMLLVSMLAPLLAGALPSGFDQINQLLPIGPAQASAAPSDTLNFQGRLLANTGALIPDGDYHIEFKLYDAVTSTGSSQGSCAGDSNCLWTETRSTGNLVTISNGYYSVYLGDVTALPDIDWSQEMYLGMNVGGSAGSATWDGEMTPRFKLTAVPYAFRAGNVASSDTNAGSTNSSDVSVVTGNALGATSNSGSITLDVGSATGTAGSINIGAGTNAPSAITLGQSGVTTTNAGALNVTQLLTANAGITINGTLTANDNVILGSSSGDTLTVNATPTFNSGLTIATGDEFTNASSSLFTAQTISNDVDGGDIGTAGATVDVATTFNVNQTTASQTITLPSPTTTTSGRIVYVNNVGTASFDMYGTVIASGQSNAFIWNGSSWVTTVSLSGTVVNTVGTIDSVTKSADGGVIASNAIYFQTADATNPGLISTGVQTIAGAKTFSADVTLDGDLAVNGDDITSDGDLTITPAGGDTNVVGNLDVSGGVTAGTGNAFQVSTGGAVTAVGVDAGTGLIQGSGGLTVSGGNTAITGGGTFQLDSSALDISTAGAVSGATTITASGNINTTGGVFQLNGTDINTAGTLTNVAYENQANTFTSANIFQGNLTVENTGYLATQRAADFSTTGSTNNASLGSASLVRLTGASAQTLTGITGGADGRQLTIINAASQAATLTNEDASSAAANRIATGTGGSVSVPAGASVNLVYDSGASLWRVVGSSASSGGDLFTLTDGTTPQTISQGNTLTVSDGTDTDLVTSATDTLTVNVTSTLASVTGRGATTTTLVNLDGGIAVDTSNFTVSGTTGAVVSAGSLTGVGVNAGTGLLQGTGGATVTGAINLNTTGTANTAIGNGTGTFSLDSDTLDISTGGAITGATGITSSGTINFSSLTANRALFTDGSSNLATTAASSALLNSLSDETGTGVAVFGTSPEITTSLTTGSTSFDLLNTTATTVNFAGAATALSIGAATGTTTINNDLAVNGDDITSDGDLTITPAGGDTNIVGALDVSAGITAGTANAFQVSAAGAITGVGVNSGTGLIQGTGGLTVSGATTLSSLTNCTALNTNGSGVVGCDATVYLSTVTLQSAYDETSGNSITTTDARDFDLVLADTTTDSNFDIDIVADNTVSISRTDNASTEAPAQLVLLENLDTNLAVNDGLRIVSAAGTIVDGIDASDSDLTNALNIGANAIAGTNFSVASGGAVTAVGVDSGSGIIEGTGGLAVTNGNFQLTGGGTFQLDSSALDISTAGVISGATGLTSSGTITFSGLDCTGNANGGVITANASGVLSCSDDDSGAASVTLQQAYDADADGSDTIIALTAADDGLVFRNPASGGLDSGSPLATFDQLNTGAVDGVLVSQAGTGYGLRVSGNGTGGELYIGSGGTADLATANGDLYVQNDVEIDGGIGLAGNIGIGLASNGINASQSISIEETNTASSYRGLNIVYTRDDNPLGSVTEYGTSVSLTVDGQANTGYNARGADQLVTLSSDSAVTSAYGNYSRVVSAQATGTGTTSLTGLRSDVTHTGSSDVNTLRGVWGNAASSSTFASGTNYVIGGDFEASKSSTTSPNDHYYGLRGAVDIASTGTANVTRALYALSTVGASATVDEAEGLRIISSNGGSINTNYGIRVDDVYDGTINTNAYSFWADNGDIVLDADGAGSAGGTSSAGGGDIVLGEGQDFFINFDGTNGQLNTTSGSLVLQGTGSSVRIGDGGTPLTATGNGELFVENDFEVHGNVRLGNSGADTITISSTISSSLIPTVGNTIDIGSSASPWRDAYFQGSAVFGSSGSNSSINYDSGTYAGLQFSVSGDSDRAYRFTDAGGSEVLAVDTTNGGVSINSEGAGGTAYDLSFGNGDATARTIGVAARPSAGTGAALTVSAGTGNGTNTGGALTLQGGNSGASGNVNGGNVILTGGTGNGTGVLGTVSLAPTTFLASVQQDFTASANITQSNIDSFSTILISSDASGYTATLSDPTIQTAGRVVYVTNVGSFDMTLAANAGAETITLKPSTTATMIWNGTDWTAAGASSSTDLQAAYDNTATSAGGAELILNAAGGAADGLTIRNNATTPLTGSLFEVQSEISTNLFSVNNAGTEYVANGGAENSTTFASDWLGTVTTVSRETNTADIATGQASVQVASAGIAGAGVANDLAAGLDTSTTYQVSFTGKLESGTAFTTLEARYSRDGIGYVSCTNYSTQTLVTGDWTKVTCDITTDATTATDPYLSIVQSDAPGSARTFHIDNLSIRENSASSTPPNVQIGGGQFGGAVTLFTLDQASSPPVASGDSTYYGSMYYDTTTGRIQCYEADGWGACGAPPNNIITLTPEYAGAVLNGTGVGTMSADFCANTSGVLQINNTVCGTDESRNYYEWTSPQATSQTYSILLTYQLPTTFDSFLDNNTITIDGYTTDTSDASITYEMFRESDGNPISECGSDTTITTTNTTWQTVQHNGDESTGCSFAAGDRIIFKINMTARNNDSVYVSDINFTYSND